MSVSSFDNSNIRDFFFERIVQLRMEKNISQREMSLSLGQNPYYIRGIESRRNFPSMDMFFEICDYFNITPMEFFSVDDKNFADKSELISQSSLLSKTEYEHILSVVKDLTRGRSDIKQ